MYVSARVWWGGYLSVVDFVLVKGMFGKNQRIGNKGQKTIFRQNLFS